MLVNAKKILTQAKSKGYAIPQFNINNLEWVKYILEECQTQQYPVILGVSENACIYMGGYNTVTNMVNGLIKDLKITIPVVLHLDHGSTIESCKKALNSGFTSVMLDASKESLEQNILATRKVVSYATKYKASVEAEIGYIGGVEEGRASGIKYTSVEDAVELAKKTNITMLAPALGTVHGLYEGEEKIDFDRMLEISKQTNLPLVLHGGTGVSKEKIIKAINCGTSKININTQLQINWSNAVKEFINNNKEIYDPRKIIGSGETAIKNTVKEIIDTFRNEKKI